MFPASAFRFFPRSTLAGHDRRVLILVVCRTITAIGFAVVFPFLSIYLHDVMHVSMTAIGSVFLVSSLVGAMSALVGGELSDRFGRKRVMVFALVTRAFVFFLIGLAVWNKAGFHVIAGLVVLSSFSGRLFEPPSSALVSDVTVPARRQEAYSLLRMGINLGWAIGPALGGFLASVSYASLFFASGITTLLGLVILLVWLKDSPAAARSERTSLRDFSLVLRDKVFLSYNLVSLLLFLVTAQLIVTLSVFAVDWVGISKVQLGYLYTLNGLMVVLVQIPCTHAVRKLRLTRILILGSLLYAVGYFSNTFANGFALLFVSMVLITFGEIFTLPASLSLVANMAPRNRYGRYMGVYELFSSIGHSLGPFVGGVIMDASMGRAVIIWGAVAIIGFLSSAGFVIIGRRLPSGIDRPGAMISEIAPVSDKFEGEMGVPAK